MKREKAYAVHYCEDCGRIPTDWELANLGQWSACLGPLAAS